MPRTSARKSPSAMPLKAKPKETLKAKPLRAPAKRVEAPPLKRKEMLDRTRTAILKSALNHFSQRGFSGASLRDIAADANVNHGMIRHIYGSKEGLWRAVITYLFISVSHEMNDEPPSISAVSDKERLKAMIRRYVTYCATHPQHAHLMVQQSIMGGAELTWAAEQFIKVRHGLYLPLFERLKASGDLPDIDTVAFHFILLGGAQMIYLLAPEVRATNGRDVFDQASIQKHADALVKIIFRDGR